MKDFEGKTAVVTGAASGIGYGLAEKLAQEKMQVVLADVEEEALNKAVNQLQQYQHRVIGVKTDVLIKESMKSMAIFISFVTTQALEQVLEIRVFGKLRKKTGIGLWESIFMESFMAFKLFFLIWLRMVKKAM